MKKQKRKKEQQTKQTPTLHYYQKNTKQTNTKITVSVSKHTKMIISYICAPRFCHLHSYLPNHPRMGDGCLANGQESEPR